MGRLCNKIIELMKEADKLMLYNGEWLIRSETLRSLKPETVEIVKYCIVSIGTWV